MRHAPFWLDRLPKSRRASFPPLRGEEAARVAIVGGGLTGAACALSFAVAGVDVVLLEAETVGGGMTAGDAGLLREGFAGSFADAVAAHGLRTSRAAWDTMRRGSLDFAAALKRYRIKCDLAPQDLITFAPPTIEAGRGLRREYQARKDAGLDAAWLAPRTVTRESAMESGGGLRTRGAVLDPYRACAGLVAAAVARDARVHERSLVRRVRASRHHVDVITDRGSLRVEAVIVATAAPIQDLRGLRRHLRAEHAYGVLTEPFPAAARRLLGVRRAVLEDAREPGRVVRWVGEDRLLIHGARQPEIAVRAREGALRQRTGQLMYELSLLYPAISGHQPSTSWDGLDHETPGGLPLLGPHRNFPRHFFALGSSRHGAGLSWTAARIALRHFLGETSRADEALGFGRIL